MEVVEQSANPSAAPSPIPEPLVAGIAPEAPAAPNRGSIDMNKPMSFEALHKAFAFESPFLAANIR
jgi:hypothetical protein